MVDLLDIGRSGLMAYRTALSVTGENIANADTEGYRRRDTIMQEISGASTAPAMKGTMPSGVTVTDIRRAFDSLLAERSRSAASSLGMSETSLTHLSALEDRLLPGDGGIPDLLDGFFDALDGLSSAPSDKGLRQVVLQAGQALAGGISDLAVGLNALQNDITEERSLAVDQANNILKQLATTQAELIRTPNTEARNPILDRRDTLLGQMAKMTDISVSMDDNDIATIRLGADGNGAAVLIGNRAGLLETRDDARLSVVSADPIAEESVRTPANGILRGLSNAAGATAQTISDLSAWAARIASEMNRVHATAVDREGQTGGPLFTLTGMDIEAGALNRGSATLSVTVTNPDLLSEDGVQLAFDATTSTWLARNAAGDQIGSGASTISLPGLNIKVEGGTARDGDRFALTPRSGSALDMTFLPQVPDDLATAGSHIVSATPGNSGSARMSASVATPRPSGKPDLSALIGDTPVEFLSSGVVGTLPADVTKAALTAQGRDAAMDFVVPAGATLSGLSLDFADGVQEFAVSGSVQHVADALNSAAVRTPDGNSLADFGLYAQTDEGTLTVLAWAGNDLPPASVQSSVGAINGVVVAEAVPAAEPQIFTRDGRQIAGAPLSPQQATDLLTVENGFYPSSQYDASFLNTEQSLGGISQSRAAVGGASSVLLNSDQPVLTWNTLPEPGIPATTLSFDNAAFSGDVLLPQGANAKWRAQILSDALPVSVSAETRLELTPPSDGTVSFRLAGDNSEGFLIQAVLGEGGPAALADAINARTPETGIRAEVAAGSGRLTFVHDEGTDIVLTRYQHGGGLEAGLQRLGPNGDAIGAPGTLSMTTGANARIAGTVTLTNPQAFGVTESGVFREAAPDAFRDGLVTRRSSASGSELTFTPTDPTPGDTASRSIAFGTPDGRELVANAAPFGLDSDGDVAAALLADLRAQAPASRLTSAPLATPPADGAQMRVALGDQTYVLRMQAGELTVTGPEEGRVTATFDPDGQLVIETNGGQLDGQALRLASDPGEAARFGIGTADAVMTTVLGAPFDAGSLPASFTITVGNTGYTVNVSSGAVTLPPTFPGYGSINTSVGRVEIYFNANSEPARIAAQSDAANAGLATLDASATLRGDGFTLTASDGRVMQAEARHQGQGSTYYLDNLPDEEFIVVMPEGGALRLSGALETGEDIPERAREIRVLDGDNGTLGLFDRDSGAFLASRVMDASGFADFGSLSVTLSGTVATGDSFAIVPNAGGTGDSTGIEALARLRQSDTQTGMGGYTEGFSRILTAAGAQVRAGEDRFATAQNVMDSATRAEENASAVDPDAEAARLMQQQQAYQANAQVISVARQLFDTLLQAL